MNHKILLHFKKNDHRIVTLIESITIEEVIPRKPRYYFVSLCSEIIGQQLSGKVADVIEARFRKLFGRNIISPKSVLSISDTRLRSAGMSNSKVRFIKDLARKVSDKQIDLPALQHLDDIGVITELTKVKGIGPWTAEMFLIFTLGRPDVFSYGDLGLRQAIRKLYKFRRDPTVRQMERITKAWSPYRSYAARLLWRYKDSTG